jgi:hypothetical protein
MSHRRRARAGGAIDRSSGGEKITAVTGRAAAATWNKRNRSCQAGPREHCRRGWLLAGAATPPRGRAPVRSSRRSQCVTIVSQWPARLRRHEVAASLRAAASRQRRLQLRPAITDDCRRIAYDSAISTLHELRVVSSPPRLRCAAKSGGQAWSQPFDEAGGLVGTAGGSISVNSSPPYRASRSVGRNCFSQLSAGAQQRSPAAWPRLSL